jgi:nucleotide-binding universal stress UspA family protein
MFQRILVPVDGSTHSMTAARFGASIASECDADLELLYVAPSELQKADAQADIERGIEPLGIVPKVSILVHDSVSGAISERCEADAGAMVVMASTGRGRSAAVLGSIAEEVLGQTFGPLVVIGPNATEPKPLAGNVIVPVDGSKFSESSLTIAGAWGIGFGGTPWIVQVLPPEVTSSTDFIESSYTIRLAQDLHTRTHREVDSEILRGSPARAIVEFASDIDGRLIVMSTHGRTGLRRVRLGSVAAGVVHRAQCPVVLHRPPNLVW